MASITYTIDSFGAVGDGLTNDSAAFVAFNSAALTWQASNTGTVTLLLTAGKHYACVQDAGGIYFAASIKTLVVDGDATNTGNSATLIDKIRLPTTATTTNSAVLTFASVPPSIFSGMPAAGTGIPGNTTVNTTTTTTVTLSTPVTVASGTVIEFVGGGFFLGGHGIVNVGLGSVGSQSCRIATVAAGSNTVTILDASKESIFTTGTWVMVAGIDLQGFGYPPNPYYKEYHQIVGANGTTLTLDTPLVNGYNSTWPSFFAGNEFNCDQGGPATLYRMTDDWSINVTYQNMIIDATPQVYGGALDITYNNISAVDGAIIPSVTRSHTCTNCTMSQVIEVDKCITNLTYIGCTLEAIVCQSASIDNVVIQNTTVSTVSSGFFNGTGNNSTLTNVTVPQGLQVGVTSYGQASKASLIDCDIGTAISGGGPFISGILTNGIMLVNGNIQWPYIFTIPTTQVSNSGTNTVTFPSGAFAWASIIQAGGATITNITNPAATPGNYTITSGTGGILTLSANFAETVEIGDQFQIQWLDIPILAVPNHWYSFGSQYNYSSPTVFQIKDLSRGNVTQGTGIIDTVFLSTTLRGLTWPGMHLLSDFIISGHPCPEFTAAGCTGSVDALDVSTAPAHSPLWNYLQRSFSGNIGTGQEVIPIYGNFISISFEITKPYTGVHATLPFDLNGPFVIETIGFRNIIWNPSIDLKQGPRTVVITPTSVTGNVGSDSGILPPGPILLVNNQITPEVSTNIGSEDSSVYPAITLTIVVNQNIPIFAGTQSVSLPYKGTVAIKF